ncbi:hypothetical protein FRB96_000812 [Tulasnella sp. 330]|nr:hypothetical protein FRB96_000812 [Tulasnella sp. 330]KAG8881943.1 hypothetical protein FRB97_008901 [Tulasnella sp. 331]
MSSYSNLHDYCRAQRIAVETVEVSEGPHDKPIWIVTIILYGVRNPAARTFVSSPAPTKRAGRKMAAAQALKYLGQEVPMDSE